VVNDYFDTSALVALYVSEAYSRAARREAQNAGQIPFTPLHELELGNALQLLRGRRLIDGRQLQLLSSHVAEDRDAERLVETPIDLHRVFERARELSAAHSARVPCRSLDVLHVASSLELGCHRFVSGDDRQLLLARALDLEGIDIKGRRRRRRT
jgi:predicted nucleic acid-binding protein